ncbi:hypothetical protein SE17_01710 [Kouleothrix aurantiaca]|uniref:Uncharacterized protein n=1 Tax=Kouleothrix aurantiaca TaxID=186479 RepID=A0A0P9HIQ8_9CHLR|nr:hypothetical protein SE17_01710 [Kouleothrix aurantiaca]
MTTSSTPDKPGAPDPDNLHAAIEQRIAKLEAERQKFVLEQHDALSQEEAILAPYAERLRQLPILRSHVAAREQCYLVAINELKALIAPPLPELGSIDLDAPNQPARNRNRKQQR